MFQSGAATEKVVSDAKKMIGLEVRQFEFQYLYGVEGINESALNDHLMNESESSVGDGTCFVGEFESNRGGRKLRFSEGCLATVGSKGDGGLVGIKKIVYSFTHLKSFVVVF